MRACWRGWSGESGDLSRLGRQRQPLQAQLHNRQDAADCALSAMPTVDRHDAGRGAASRRGAAEDGEAPRRCEGAMTGGNGNHAGDCCICGQHLGHYDSKHIDRATGRIACAFIHLDKGDDDYSQPTTLALRGFEYWTDG